MKEPLEYTYSPRIFGQPYGELSDELQEYARRMAAIVEENQFRAFNEGCESVRAQAKAEKAPETTRQELEYIIETAHDIQGLSYKVQASMQRGGRPVGGLCVVSHPSSAATDYTFCQAMIRGGKE